MNFFVLFCNKHSFFRHTYLSVLAASGPYAYHLRYYCFFLSIVLRCKSVAEHLPTMGFWKVFGESKLLDIFVLI